MDSVKIPLSSWTQGVHRARAGCGIVFPTFLETCRAQLDSADGVDPAACAICLLPSQWLCSPPLIAAVGLFDTLLFPS